MKEKQESTDAREFVRDCVFNWVSWMNVSMKAREKVDNEKGFDGTMANG